MLPAYPWSQRPDDLPLTADEVCAALSENGGDITRTSLRLKVGSLVLRKFVERSAKARAVIQEMKDRLADKAASKLEEALDSGDDRRVDWAIRYVLNSRNARKLGWGGVDEANSQPLVSLTLPPSGWANGEQFPMPKEAARQIIDLTALPPSDG